MGEDHAQALTEEFRVSDNTIWNAVNYETRVTVSSKPISGNWAEREAISYRPLRGRYEEGPSKGPSISQVPASPVSSRLLPGSGCNRG